MASCQLVGDGNQNAAPYEFPPLKELLLGRDPAATPEAKALAGAAQAVLKVAEKYATVSRLHARIAYDETQKQFTLTGLSQNGTLVDGQKIAERSPVPLRSGASIKLSPEGPAFRFQVMEQAGARSGGGATEQLMKDFFGHMGKAGSGNPGERTMNMGRELLRRVADRSTGRKFKVIIGLVMILAAAGVGSYFYQRKTSQEQASRIAEQSSRLSAQSSQLAQAQSQLARSQELLGALQGRVSTVQTQVLSVQADSGKIRALESRLHSYETSPKPSQENLSEVYKKISGSVFFISVKPRTPHRESWSAGMGTAWAAAPHVLVTNAHVALGIMSSAKEMRQHGEEPVGYAVLSGERETECHFEADGPRIFQRYLNNHHEDDEADGEAFFYDDVAAFKTDCNLIPLEMLSPSEYGTLQSGTGLVLAGFPEIVMHYTKKQYKATFSTGHLMQFDDETLIHSALESGGSSGSPIVDMKGRVIGINAGVFSEKRKIGNFGTGPSVLRVQALLREM